MAICKWHFVKVKFVIDNYRVYSSPDLLNLKKWLTWKGPRARLEFTSQCSKPVEARACQPLPVHSRPCQSMPIRASPIQSMSIHVMLTHSWLGVIRSFRHKFCSSSTNKFWFFLWSLVVEGIGVTKSRTRWEL